MMAKRANAKTVEVNASHVAYMSYPKETAKLIEEAALRRHRRILSVTTAIQIYVIDPLQNPAAANSSSRRVPEGSFPHDVADH